MDLGRMIIRIAIKCRGSLENCPVLVYNSSEVMTMPKILIVDDEQEIVALVKRYAEREGYETVCAYDGAEAVEICKTEGRS